MKTLVSVMKKYNLNEDEAVAVIRSLSKSRKPIKTTKINISDESFSFGYFSDAHIGQKQFQPELFQFMVGFFKERKPDFILNAGDNLEGMSGRPGHIYELNCVGFKQQFNYCLELYKQLDEFDHYGIDGNHDQWYFKKNDGGVVVGEELEKSLKNYHHLGQDEGDIVVNKIKIKLYHGGDGTA